MKLPSDQEYIAFSNFMDKDIERVDQLCEHFDQLELLEKKHGSRKFKKNKKYERMFRGIALISSISKIKLQLTRENGSTLGDLFISRGIQRIILKSDILDVTLGFRDGLWRIIRVHYIHTAIPDNLDVHELH